jgi:hypothetical protein
MTMVLALTMAASALAPTGAQSPSVTVDERYNLKVEGMLYNKEGSYEVTINGTPAGRFTENTNIDVTPLFKAGRNEVKIRSVQPKPASHHNGITIGALRFGKWATLLTHFWRDKGDHVRTYLLHLPTEDVFKHQTPPGKYTLKTESTLYCNYLCHFDISINGVQVGVISTDTEIDVTRYLKPGSNTVAVSNDFSRRPQSQLKLTVGVVEGGQWKTLVNHAVAAQGKSTKTYTLMAGGSVSTSPAAGRPSETYVLKTNHRYAGKTEFTVFMNGLQVGTFNATTSIEVTDFLKKGINQVKIISKVDPKMGWYGTVTIGVNRGGKWATMVSHRVEKDSPSGSKTYTIAVR